ncbi:MAG: hypothetical protein KIH69_000575 [Anaerolineae bacterium]|nr:hypothetical protein [Anaerolineae bacterium]
MEIAVNAQSEIVKEKGRWVVYLNVTFWELDDYAGQVNVLRRRIADYATQERAKVAASFMERAANRDSLEEQMR